MAEASGRMEGLDLQPKGITVAILAVDSAAHFGLPSTRLAGKGRGGRALVAHARATLLERICLL